MVSVHPHPETVLHAATVKGKRVRHFAELDARHQALAVDGRDPVRVLRRQFLQSLEVVFALRRDRSLILLDLIDARQCDQGGQGGAAIRVDGIVLCQAVVLPLVEETGQGMESGRQTLPDNHDVRHDAELVKHQDLGPPEAGLNLVQHHAGGGLVAQGPGEPQVVPLYQNRLAVHHDRLGPESGDSSAETGEDSPQFVSVIGLDANGLDGVHEFRPHASDSLRDHARPVVVPVESDDHRLPFRGLGALVVQQHDLERGLAGYGAGTDSKVHRVQARA